MPLTSFSVGLSHCVCCSGGLPPNALSVCVSHCVSRAARRQFFCRSACRIVFVPWAVCHLIFYWPACRLMLCRIVFVDCAAFRLIFPRSVGRTVFVAQAACRLILYRPACRPTLCRIVFVFFRAACRLEFPTHIQAARGSINMSSNPRLVFSCRRELVSLIPHNRAMAPKLSKRDGNNVVKDTLWDKCRVPPAPS